MTTIAQPAVTSGQIKQLHRLAEDAYAKALEQFKTMLTELNPDNPGAQRLIEHGDEVVVVLMNTDAVRASLLDLSVTDKYKDEEVKSSYAYPKAYKPKSIAEQTKRLRELFPTIGHADEKLAEAPLPQNAEGYFAIPTWKMLGATYQEALEKVLAKIAETRTDGFRNYREGALGSDNIRLTERTKAAFEKLEVEQVGHDILVVPIQFGLRHRGRSVRRAREVFQQNEFGLDPFTVAIMILVHPERFTRYEDLCVDCAGAEYAPVADGDFSHALCFYWIGGELEFHCYWATYARDSFGSASGFLGSQQ